MSKWNKEELENMLEDVVNELELSESAVAKYGQEGTAPAELVRLVLEEKDLKIRALEANFVDASKSNCNIPLVSVSLPTPEEIWEKADEMLPSEFTEWYKEHVGYER